MERRDVFTWSVAALSAVASDKASAAPPSVRPDARQTDPLPAPARGMIDVAFVLAPGAEVVDFAGPWGVFEYASVADREDSPFRLFTVAESKAAIQVSGGLTVVPDHAFAQAPEPRVIVVPALRDDPSPAMLTWLRQHAQTVDLTMSVCNGAFVLAKAGLLDGKPATTHHSAFALLYADFPKVKVQRGARFVNAGKVSTSGGLTSGIDLALNVVERYFGRRAAEETASKLEYQGQGWKDASSNRAYAKRPVSTALRPICPVCESALDKTSIVKLSYRGRTVLFCSDWCKSRFEASPERFVLG